MKKSIFIGSSVEGLDVAHALQENLEFDFSPTVWNQGVFDSNSYTLTDLIRISKEVESAIMIFTPDDIINLRDETYQVARDNVIFELGLFISELGREKVFCVIPRGVSNFHIPTDLLGINTGSYDYKRTDGNLNAALGPFCNQFRRKLGNISNFSTKSMITLCTRRDLDRLEAILENVKHDIIIAGINLEIAIQLNSSINRLAEKGIKIRLLSLDPASNSTEYLSNFSDVDFEDRKVKIEINHKILSKNFKDLIASNILEIRKFDGILSVGSIAMDLEHPKGRIITQQYLYRIKTDKLPLLDIEHSKHTFWFDVYKTQLLSTWDHSKPI